MKRRTYTAFFAFAFLCAATLPAPALAAARSDANNQTVLSLFTGVLQTLSAVIAQLSHENTVPQQVAAGGASNAAAAASNVGQLTDIVISNPVITGGSVAAASIAGTLTNAINAVAGEIDDLTGRTLTYQSATFTNATTTNLVATSATTTNLYASGQTAVAALALPNDVCSSYGNGGKLTTDSNGDVICAADQSGGSGSTVAGSANQVQYNGGGSFGASASLTFNPFTNQLAVTNASTSAATTTSLYASAAVLANATSSSFAISGVPSSLLKTTAAGSVIPAIAGTDYVATTAGNWSGTFGTFAPSYYLDARNLTNFATPFASALAGTTTSALAEGSNLYFTTARVDARFVVDLAATTSVASITTLPGLSLPYSQLSGTPNLSNYLALSAWYATTSAPQLNAGTVTKLQNARTINGTAFDGSQNITITAASSSLLGDANTWTAAQTFGTGATINGGLTLGAALSVGNGGTGITNPLAAGILLGTYGGSGWQQLATSSLGLLTTNVAEGSNLYFTPGRAQSAISVVGAPLSYSSGVVGINQANAAQPGYLSSSDWTNFNGKLASTSLSAAYPLAFDSGTGAFTLGFGTTTTNTWSGTNTFTGSVTLGNMTTQTVSPTGTLANYGTFNTPIDMLIRTPSDNAADVTSAGQHIPTSFDVETNFGGSSMNDGRNGIGVLLNMATATSPTNPYRFYAAGNFFGNTAANDNGTSGSPQGYLYGIGAVARLQSPATYWAGVFGAEFNVAVDTGASVQKKAVLSLIDWPEDAVSGTLVDADIYGSAGSGAIGLTNFIQTDNNIGEFPVVATGDLWKAYGGTVGNGLDWSGMTITGFAIKTPGFSVDGSGHINASGGIGIGTTTPFAKLAISLNNGDSSFYNNAFLVASSTSNATSTLFVVNNSGFVGIGTASPIAPLDVGNASNVTNNASSSIIGGAATLPTTADGYDWVSELRDTSGNVSRLLFGEHRTLAGLTWTTGAWRIQPAVDNGFTGVNSNRGYLEFAYGSAGSYQGVGISGAGGTSPNMVVNASGNVAIGATSTVAGVLTVHEMANQNITFTLNNNGTMSGAPGIQSINDANSAYEPLGFDASQYYFAGGNVGIGTTTPYSRLEVWGPDTASTTAFVVVNNASTTVFASYDNGNATYSGSLFQSSDQRLKTDITTLDASSSLALVAQLNPVEYTRIDQPDQGTTLGFIAQQVQRVFPDLVSTTSPTTLTPDGTLTLNYSGLVAPLVAAVQAVQNEIAAIENTIAGFAQNFTSERGTFTDALCVGSTCVTPAQFQAMVAAANQSAAAPTSPASSSSTPDSTTSTSSEQASSPQAPVIAINGDNPAIIQVGASYTDLGASITGPQADLNLGIKTFVNGLFASTIQLDTSAAATDTIGYVVTDQNGFTSTSTRTVFIEAPPQSGIATSTATTTALN